MAFDYGLSKGAIIQVLCWQRLNEQRILNTFYYEYDGNTPPSEGGRAELQALLADFATDDGLNVVGSIQNCQSQDMDWERVTAQQVFPARRPPESIQMTNTAGQLFGNAAPANAAAVITREGSLGGRRGNGSLHIAGVVAASLANSRIGIELQQQLQVVCDKLDEPCAGVAGAFIPILWRPSGGAVSNVIFRARPELTARVMRRRTVGQGV